MSDSVYGFDALSISFFNGLRLFEGNFGLFHFFCLNRVFLVCFPFKILCFTSNTFISASYLNPAYFLWVLKFCISNPVLVLVHYTDTTKNKIVKMFAIYQKNIFQNSKFIGRLWSITSICASCEAVFDYYDTLQMCF